MLLKLLIKVFKLSIFLLSRINVRSVGFATNRINAINRYDALYFTNNYCSRSLLYSSRKYLTNSATKTVETSSSHKSRAANAKSSRAMSQLVMRTTSTAVGKSKISNTKQTTRKTSTNTVVSKNKLPSSINVFNLPVSEVKGIGSILSSKLVNNLGIKTVSDLLFHLPVGYIDRTQRVTSLNHPSVRINGFLTIELVVDHIKLGNELYNSPHCVYCKDSTGKELVIKYFYANKPYLNRYWLGLRSNVYLKGEKIVVSGRYTYNTRYSDHSITNPDIVHLYDYSSKEEQAQLDRKIHASLVDSSYPVYRLTEGITSKKLNDYIESAIEMVECEIYAAPSFPLTSKTKLTAQSKEPVPNSQQVLQQEWLDKDLVTKHKLPRFIDALRHVHNPSSRDDLDPIKSKARLRLALEELITLQLTSFEREASSKLKHFNHYKDVRRQQQQQQNGGETSQAASSHGVESTTADDIDYSVQSNNAYYSLLRSSLPFQLTECQLTAVDEISTDLASRTRMVRLVQGDVGSGKTIVAVMAILKAIEAGKQVVLLAPTEILAKQHCTTIQGYLDVLKTKVNGSSDAPAAFTVNLLTSSVKPPVRQSILSALAANKINVLVGTHSVLNVNVLSSFHSLALVIVDEEQRFGVEQRNSIAELTNTLYTTATPIPRSLSLLAVQDNFHVSSLFTKLPIKRPVKTQLLDLGDLRKVIEFIHQHIKYGTKIFWVTPVLNANSHFLGSSAKERFEILNKLFPGKVGLIYGRQSSEEKDDVIRRFTVSEDDNSSSGGDGINILVATTVIEVGIDIPDASVCVIERASYFGLSQLHQIRGRIGRGKSPKNEKLSECLCILLDSHAPSDNGTSSKVVEDVAAASDTGEDEDLQMSVSDNNDAVFARLKCTASLTADSEDGVDEMTYDDVDITELNRALATSSFSVAKEQGVHESIEASFDAAVTSTDATVTANNGLLSLPDISNMLSYADENGSYRAVISDMAKNRLEFFCRSNDCFEIAEYDLRLRGMGDIFGFRQHGKVKYRAASMPVHLPLLLEAKQIASKIFSNQYHLPSHRGAGVDGEKLQSKSEPIQSDHSIIQLLKAMYLCSADSEEGDDDFTNTAAAPYKRLSRLGKYDDVLSENEVNTLIESSHQSFTTAAVHSVDSVTVTVTPSVSATAASVGQISDQASVMDSDKYENIMQSLNLSIQASSPARVSLWNSAMRPVLLPTSASTAAGKAVSAGKKPKSGAYTDDDPANIAWLDRHWPSSGATSSSSAATAAAEQEPLFVVLDTESTGLNVTSDEITQLAAKVMGDNDAIFNAYILPSNARVSAMIEDLTGISQSFLEAEGQSFIDAWTNFQSWILEQATIKTQNSNEIEFRPVVFIAQNGLRFDFPIIKNCCVRAFEQRIPTVKDAAAVQSLVDSSPDYTEGRNLQFWFSNRLDIRLNYRFLDTLQIFRDPDMWSADDTHSSHTATAGRVASFANTYTNLTSAPNIATINTQLGADDKWPKPKLHNQSMLYKHVIGREMSNAHNALGDVEALEELLLAPGVHPYWRAIARRRLFY